MLKLEDRLAQATPVAPKSCNGRDRRPATRPPVRSRILPPRARKRELATWIARQINAGHPKLLVRTKHFATWFVFLFPRMAGFVAAITGPRFTADKARERDAICAECPRLQIRLTSKSPGTRLYCGACGCPKWPLSELRWKNRLQRWQCPMGLHARSPEPAAWLGIREREAAWVAAANAAKPVEQDEH